MKNFDFLFWAYNIIWILIAGYLALIFARQRTIKRQIQELRDRLSRQESQNHREG